MKIIILQGSPNKNGSTAILTEEFTRGAKEAGHEVHRIDVDEFDINPCTGCVACGYEGPCVQKDDNEMIRSAVLAVAWNSDNWTFDSLESHYRTLVRYLHFNDQGMILGRGCGSPGMTRNTEYPEKAYELGRSL